MWERGPKEHTLLEKRVTAIIHFFLELVKNPEVINIISPHLLCYSTI